VLQVFEFRVSNPDVAHLMFRVMDADLDRDDFIGFSSIPVLSLVEGYRNVALYDKKCSKNGEMLYASLFVCIRFDSPSKTVT
jgi:hypothetical protein